MSSRGSVPDRFVYVVSEINRILPDVSSDHPNFYEFRRMRELAFISLDDGIAAAMRVCDLAEGFQLMKREQAQAKSGDQP